MQSEKFRALIRYYMELRGMHALEEVRLLTTVGSNQTFLKYWKEPERIPQGTILQIMNGLRVPREEWFTWV